MMVVGNCIARMLSTLRSCAPHQQAPSPCCTLFAAAFPLIALFVYCCCALPCACLFFCQQNVCASVRLSFFPPTPYALPCACLFFSHVSPSPLRALSTAFPNDVSHKPVARRRPLLLHIISPLNAPLHLTMSPMHLTMSPLHLTMSPCNSQCVS